MSNILSEMEQQYQQRQQELAEQEKVKERARQAVAMERKMREYAIQYRKKHPKVKPQRLMRIVAKKFNVKLT